MMDIRLIIVFCLFLIGCSPSDNKEGSYKDMGIWLNEIYINHYEKDSLNRNRGYVIPRLYYVFGYANPTPDSVEVVLDQYFGEKTDNVPFLNVFFEYKGVKDTLVLSDYESINPVVITPNESGIFTVGVPVSDYLKEDKYQSETAANFMKHIAENGTVIYNSPNLGKQRLALKSQIIKKSKAFRVLFRDPDDTTVE
jgi:hypothetical protein